MISVTAYRWTSSTRLKRHDTGEEIRPGETFEPTDSELRAFGNQIEEIDAGEATPDGEMTIEQIEKDLGVSFSEYDSVEAVKEAYVQGELELEALDGALEEFLDIESDDETADSSEDVAFDADAWFDDHDGYQDRIETVESGVVDEVLDEIEDCERSDNVIDAVDARRNELSDD